MNKRIQVEHPYREEAGYLQQILVAKHLVPSLTRRHGIIIECPG